MRITKLLKAVIFANPSLIFKNPKLTPIWEAEALTSYKEIYSYYVEFHVFEYDTSTDFIKLNELTEEYVNDAIKDITQTILDFEDADV